LPASALTLWLLHAWIRDGELTAWPVLCGWASLLIHLLAAGAVGYPGVGQMVWLLPALALSVSASVAAGTDTAAPERADRRGGERTRIAAVLFAIQLALLAACYLTMYRPVLHARRYLSDPGGPAGSVRPESVLQAAAADPWAADPWELLVERACREWIRDPTLERLAAFDQAAGRLLDLNRQSSSARRFCGDLSLEMFAASSDPALMARAIAFYRQAIERYPHSNILYAQLAWSCYLAGEIAMARQAAETALQLDSLLPHQELKLRNRTLVGQDLAPTTGAGSAELNAEQIVDRIRKTSDDEQLNR
jgi:tetratricopeptide (TPR) repeat protein